MANPYLPREAEIVERIQESPTVFTLRLRLVDPAAHAAYRFAPGQFNMVYLYGVGEVPISIVSDPAEPQRLDHTIRAVGRVTRGLAGLRAGERLGIRGPFGRGWPLEAVQGRDVILVTGGLGCAPVVSVIRYIMRRRAEFGRLVIMQGVKHVDDLIWREQYQEWAAQPHTQVLLAADVAGADWPWHVGLVTELFDQVKFDLRKSLVMMCGPEIMMRVASQGLLRRGAIEDNIWLSLERSMHCAVGHCGHCQFADRFVCRDGPVFAYPRIKDVFGAKGF